MMEALGGQYSDPDSFVTLPPVCGRSPAPRLRGTAVLTAGPAASRGPRGLMRLGSAVKFSSRARLAPTWPAICVAETDTRGGARR